MYIVIFFSLIEFIITKNIFSSYRGLGMDESLFVRLENGPATFELNLQYRMNR